MTISPAAGVVGGFNTNLIQNGMAVDFGFFPLGAERPKNTHKGTSVLGQPSVGEKWH